MSNIQEVIVVDIDRNDPFYFTPSEQIVYRRHMGTNDYCFNMTETNLIKSSKLISNIRKQAMENGTNLIDFDKETIYISSRSNSNVRVVFSKKI